MLYVELVIIFSVIDFLTTYKYKTIQKYGSPSLKLLLPYLSAFENHVVSSFSPEYTVEVRDLILRDNPYTALNQNVLHSLSNESCNNYSLVRSWETASLPSFSAGCSSHWVIVLG